ncbi:hypothetical protein ACH4MG_03100 [Streptomyces sp. NPDC017454]|uniref:hypothetical protein n=1 Tax=Streptomyces sp. NPDC017454 TaxID=3364997 RepID=UPI003794F0F1
MRRTARALSAAVLASAALGVVAGPVSADPGVPQPSAGAGEPAAEVSPADVTPGGTVTVSVACASTGGAAPATLDATSPAFDGGTVALRKVEGDGGTTSGPAYRGTARIAAAEDFEADPDTSGSEDAWTVDGACPEASGGEGDPWSATMTMPGENGGAVTPPCPAPAEPGEPAAPAEPGAAGDAGAPAVPGAPGTPGTPGTPGEPCGASKPACPDPAAPHGEASAHGTSCATKPACPEPAAPHGEASAQGKPCGGATVEHGVRAGTGGAFTDSTPALVAGGVLITGAFGAAAHRLRHRLRGDAEHR